MPIFGKSRGDLPLSKEGGSVTVGFFCERETINGTKLLTVFRILFSQSHI